MKRIIVFALSLLLFVSMPVKVMAQEKEIKVKSSILMCMNTGDIMSEENAYEHLSPASVTKVVSLSVILDAIDKGQIKLDNMVAASENAVSKGGSQIWLEVGEQMSVNDLLKAVIIASANDACTALAEYVAGSDSAFVDKMNDKIKSLGLKDSHFENCTGLDDEITNHYSCAYDLAVVACDVMKHDIITKYSTVWLDSLRDGETELNNTNKLVNTYSGITGLKTGTTSKAGFCLCATASRDGMNLVSVVLGAETSKDRFDKSTQLLDYGFATYKIEKLVLDEKKLTEVKVKNGIVKSIKPSVCSSDDVMVLKNSGDFEYEYSISKEIKAPVKSGDELGKIIVKCEGKNISSIKVISDKDIDKVTFRYVCIYLLKNI